MKTGYYQPVYENEWAASSPYVELEGGLIQNNIAYYVEGNDKAATKLKVVLNVHSSNVAPTAHSTFLQAIALLYLLAFNKALPISAIGVSKNLQVKEGNRIISV